MMKKLLSILLAAALIASLAVQALASYEVESGSMTASGMAVVDGVLYVADSWNNAVWQLEDGGGASPLAGRTDVKDSSGRPMGGYADGSFSASAFNEPWAIAPYGEGLLVSDSGNGALRWLDLENEKVYTAIDGLSLPTGLAVGEDGFVYISDTGSSKIYRLDADGKYEVYVGSGLNEPTGLAWHDGVLYVADTGSHRILTVTDGRVEVLAGARLTGDAAYEGGYLDGSADEALFSGPQGVAVGPDGSVYIADTGNSAVRVLRGGVVTTLAAAGDSDTWPVSPRALLVYNGLLYVGDVFSRSTGVIDVSAGALPFEDVAAGAWYYDAVAFVSANGLFDGTSETAFSPNGQMTRAMVITVLARHAGIDTSVGATWYDAAVDWALETGVSDGSDLEGSITREQLATMLYREAGSPAVSGSLEGYVDADEVSYWAADAMLWAVAEGIIEGAGGNALTPTTPATRAQTAAILQRYITQS
ncbi:MAG TPA: S-layer homology domain-containing protein [Candidatus Scatomorpha pullistercoris]|uniref:S-layer homology domain-containing protein n=1 Tax=Candidatus Scatomorpha pullistercoris TaxID=2840929 RepID=A0A9D1G2T8_9FIRM|nr:S-layer homology domain-containing protein [Candidatus Scatomorpha pullistercoris]